MTSTLHSFTNLFQTRNQKLKPFLIYRIKYQWIPLHALFPSILLLFCKNKIESSMCIEDITGSSSVHHHTHSK